MSKTGNRKKVKKRHFLAFFSLKSAEIWLTALEYFRTFQFFERNGLFFFLSVINDFQMIVVEKDAVHERVDEFPAALQLPDVYLSEIA